MANPEKTVQWSGSAPEPISWETLVEIFDALFGASFHGLPEWPAVAGHTTARWTDATGTTYKLEHLDELRGPYEQGRTGAIKFEAFATGEQSAFTYSPGAPRPRARAFLTAAPEGIEGRMAPVQAAFALPFEGTEQPVIFLSWGGELSKSVAEMLQVILEERFPTSKVFFSPESIEIGDDPMFQIFELHLLRTDALVVVLTTESASRAWLIWETAAVWARGRLVAPIYVDIDPEHVPGPLSLKAQGARVGSRHDVDRLIGKVGEAVGDSESHTLSDQEWRLLSESTTAVIPATVGSHLPAFPARYNQTVVHTSLGLNAGTLWALQVLANGPLDECAILMTSIIGPPGAEPIPVPARLRWHPSGQILSNIAQGASDLVHLVNVGPFPPSALIESPDYQYPRMLEDGAWRVELQITARGHVAQFLELGFRVIPTEGIPNQQIEWTELTVRPSS
jgi:hypothetical protein